MNFQHPLLRTTRNGFAFGKHVILHQQRISLGPLASPGYRAGGTPLSYECCPQKKTQGKVAETTLTLGRYFSISSDRQ
jgi:hypothetical protein